MTASVRALFAALLVIAVAAVAALAIGSKSGIIAMRSSNGPLADVATTGDVNRLFNGNTGDSPSLTGIALGRMETNYYKAFEPQTPINGEATALQQYLKSKKIANPALPHETATGDVHQDASELADELSYAQDHYASKLGPNGRTDLAEVALRGILNSVDDPYTVYLSPREIQGLNESLSGGNFGGIGVYIYQLKDGRIVVQPIEQSPAAHSGMKPGEIVDTVDGKRVSGLPLDRVEQLIRGEAGSTVHLTTHQYQGDRKEHSYAIVRQIIHVPTVHQKMEDGYDYIRLSDFGETSADEVRAALLKGQAAHAKGYILDLRDNGGGLVDAAVDISSMFIPQGTIVSTIDRQGVKTEQEARGNAIGNLTPLVILVNKYTASASEITSGALQDYHLATLIGTKTFGKGVVQSIYPMPDQGALKITTARYVTPAGRDIQHKGIVPDIVIDQDPDPSIIDTPKDKQLAAAKARLAEQH
jgi:carboxyl-terminal processing protease